VQRLHSGTLLSRYNELQGTASSDEYLGSNGFCAASCIPAYAVVLRIWRRIQMRHFDLMSFLFSSSDDVLSQINRATSGQRSHFVIQDVLINKRVETCRFLLFFFFFFFFSLLLSSSSSFYEVGLSTPHPTPNLEDQNISFSLGRHL
jgi:hypothetical protein